MDTTSVIVIAFAVVFMGIIGGLVLYSRRPPKDGSVPDAGREGRRQR
jgi:hypothetical protein